jgi:hypothetical protein
LNEIGPFGFIVAKDFGSVLSMAREPRAQVLAALREIYDGSWVRRVGVDGGKALPWSGKVAILAGCTPVIDNHHGVMASMGERFTFFRLNKVEEDELIGRAMRNADRVSTFRQVLSEIVAAFFEALSFPEHPYAIDERERQRLSSLASLAARCRSAVERDPVRLKISAVSTPLKWLRLAVYWIARFRFDLQPEEQL